MFDQNAPKSVWPVLAILILAAAGYFIYRDFSPAPSGKTEVNTAATPAIGNVIITPVELKKTSVSAPDLNKPVVWNALGETAEFKAEVTAKINAIVARLKENPSSIGDWIELGLYRKTAGDYEGTRAVWEYAAAIAPSNHVPLLNLGDLYQYYFKNYPKAEGYMKKIVTLSPDDTTGYRALYGLYTVSYKEKIGETPKILSAGLAKNPDNYDLLILMASYYKMTGDKTNAKIYYEKALAAADKAGMAAMKQALENELSNLSK